MPLVQPELVVHKAEDHQAGSTCSMSYSSSVYSSSAKYLRASKNQLTVRPVPSEPLKKIEHELFNVIIDMVMFGPQIFLTRMGPLLQQWTTNGWLDLVSDSFSPNLSECKLLDSATGLSELQKTQLRLIYVIKAIAAYEARAKTRSDKALFDLRSVNLSTLKKWAENAVVLLKSQAGVQPLARTQKPKGMRQPRESAVASSGNAMVSLTVLRL